MTVGLETVALKASHFLDSIHSLLNGRTISYPVFRILKYFIQRSGEEREEKIVSLLRGRAIPELTAILMPQLSKGLKGTSYYTQLTSSYTQLAFEKKNNMTRSNSQFVGLLWTLTLYCEK